MLSSSKKTQIHPPRGFKCILIWIRTSPRFLRGSSKPLLTFHFSLTQTNLAQKEFGGCSGSSAISEDKDSSIYPWVFAKQTKSIEGKFAEVSIRDPMTEEDTEEDI